MENKREGHTLDETGRVCSCHARFLTRWEAKEHATGIATGPPMPDTTTPEPERGYIEELLGCPFCGKRGNEVSPLDYRIDDAPYVVSCDDTRGGCGVCTDQYLTPQAAATAWNRRAPDKLAQLVREAGPEIVEKVARAICERLGVDTDSWQEITPSIEAVLRTLKELADER